MIILDTPPTLILPDHYEAKRPAIIRPGVDLANYFPVEIDRKTRRAIVSALVKAGAIEDRSELRRKVEAAIPFGMFSAKKPPSVQFNNSYTDNVSRTTYTYSAVDFGSESDRSLVVICVGGQGGTNRAISSVTIGGVGGTQVATSGSAPANSCIYQAEVTGTSGTVVVVWAAGSYATCGISSYSLYNLSSTTKKQSITDVDTGGGTATTTLGLNVDAGDVIVAYSNCRDGDATGYTWTGVTEDMDQPVNGSNLHSSGSAVATSSGSPRTITGVTNTLANTIAGAAATWA